MGMSPEQVDACSIWQFQAAADGFRRANMSEKDRANDLSPQEEDELAAWVGA